MKNKMIHLKRKVNSLKSKINSLSFIDGIICGVLIMLLLNSFTQYHRNITSVEPVTLSYKDTQMSCHLPGYSARFEVAKRTLYFGKLPEEAENIQIHIPTKVTITVYPNDDDSVIIQYDPRNFGITRNYKLSGYGGFNEHLEHLYMITENEVFNRVMDLPETR